MGSSLPSLEHDSCRNFRVYRNKIPYKSWCLTANVDGSYIQDNNYRENSCKMRWQYKIDHSFNVKTDMCGKNPYIHISYNYNYTTRIPSTLGGELPPPPCQKALPHYTFDPDRIQLRRIHTAPERMRIEPIRIGSR